MVGRWGSRFVGFSLAYSKEQDYREFSNLRFHLPEHPLRKRERRFGIPTLPVLHAVFRLGICGTVPLF